MRSLALVSGVAWLALCAGRGAAQAEPTPPAQPPAAEPPAAQTPEVGPQGDAAPKPNEATAPAEAKQTGDDTWAPKFDKAAFVQYLQKRQAGAQVLEAFASDWELGADAGITGRALRAIDAPFDQALALLEEGKPEGQERMAQVLERAIRDADPYVRAHARFEMARALIDEDFPELASKLLADYVAEDRGYSLLDPAAAFYLGYALSIVPRVDEAILNLRIFLELYPDASERYRANAMQLLQELEAQWDSPLHAIADDMKYCERKLKKEQTGKIVETKQLDIVEKLDLLIKQLEEQQQQGGGGPPNGNQAPNGPANQSQVTPGPGRVGQLHGSRGVKDRWGEMKDRDREKILNELQTKLPERYRALLESYYKRLNKGDR